MSNYLTEIVNENFEREILSGHITQADLVQLYKENKLTDAQLKIVEEAGLRSAIAGLGNMAKTAGSAIGQGAKSFGNKIGQKVSSVGSNIKQNVQQAGQNMKSSYQQGRNKQDQLNAIKAFQTNWNNNTSRMFEGLLRAFPDQNITQAVASIQEWAKYIEQLMTKVATGGQQQQPAAQQNVQQQQQPVQNQQPAPQDDSRWQPPANMVQQSQPQQTQQPVKRKAATFSPARKASAQGQLSTGERARLNQRR